PLVREAVRELGYDDPETAFNADGVHVLQHVTGQSWEIGRSVDPATNLVGEQGAGDQGIVFGYATSETPERMPLPILLAHALSRGLAEDRRSGAFPWLRPDGKTQVSVAYEGGQPARVTEVLVSTQHAPEVDSAVVRHYVQAVLAPRALGRWFDGAIHFTVNPSGSFVKGGPAADCGVTGRKIIVDTYGRAARHGGGAFSGKDPSKVDRSGAYFCRYGARKAIEAGVAEAVRAAMVAWTMRSARSDCAPLSRPQRRWKSQPRGNSCLRASTLTARPTIAASWRRNRATSEASRLDAGRWGLMRAWKSASSAI